MTYMNSISVDNLIVGAGPAGCSAGFTLLEKGAVNTLIIEREALASKDKLCGGLFLKDTAKLLVDVFHNFKLPPLTYVDSVQFVFQNESFTDKNIFALTRRRELDTWMMQQFLARGGRLLESFHTTTIDESRHLLRGFDRRTGKKMEISYKKLLAADGTSSTVRRLLTGRMGRRVLAMELELESEGLEPGIVIVHEPALKGYLWSFTHKHGTNLGAVYAALPDLGVKAQLESGVKRICQRLHVTYKRPRSALIPFGDDILLKRGDVLFLGDAAGLIDPYTFGGIHHALLSGMYAAFSLTGGDSYTAMAEEWVQLQMRRCSER